MRKTAIALCLISGSLLLGTSRTDGCGGALMSVGSGTRFSRASDFPARVLLDARPGSQFASVAPRLAAYLAGKGHKATTLVSIDALNQAVDGGPYDIVLTDLINAASVRPKTPKIVVVPLTGKLPKAERSAVEQKYKYRIQNPKDGDEYLEVIYKVMTSASRKST